MIWVIYFPALQKGGGGGGAHYHHLEKDTCSMEPQCPSFLQFREYIEYIKVFMPSFFKYIFNCACGGCKIGGEFSFVSF